MSDGMSNLERRIDLFETLLQEMRDATRDAHSALKALQKERREFERLLSKEVQTQVDECVAAVVKTELDRIGPMLREHTSEIYDKVNKEVDKLVDLCLGKEFSVRNGREDLRPMLAAKLKEWINEVILEES